MADAMGRSLGSILFGAFKVGSTAGSTVESERPVRSSGPEDVAIVLGYSQKVIIVQGFGLAVAQAQHVVHELAPGHCAWVHIVQGEATLVDFVLSAGDGAGVAAERAIALTAREETEILLIDLGEPRPGAPDQRGTS